MLTRQAWRAQRLTASPVASTSRLTLDAVAVQRASRVTQLDKAARRRLRSAVLPSMPQVPGDLLVVSRATASAPPERRRPDDAVLARLVDEADHAAILRHTATHSPTTLPVRLAAVVHLQAWPLLASITDHVLSSPPQAAFDADTYNLLLRAHVACSSPRHLLRRIAMASASAGHLPTIHTQAHLFQGYVAAGHGARYMRRILGFIIANNVAKIPGASKVIEAWILYNIQCGRFKSAHHFAHLFKIDRSSRAGKRHRRSQERPKEFVLPPVNGFESRPFQSIQDRWMKSIAHLPRPVLQPTTSTLLVLMKLYNSAGHPDVVVKLARAAPRLGIQLDGAALAEVVTAQSDDLDAMIETISTATEGTVNGDSLAPLVLPICRLRGMTGVRDLLHCMTEARVRPTPSFLKAYVDTLKSVDVLPVVLSEAVVAAVAASNGDLVPNGQLVHSIGQYMVAWITTSQQEPETTSRIQRSIAKVHTVSTDGLIGSKSSQSRWIQRLAEAARLKEMKHTTNYVPLDPSDDRLGLGHFIALTRAVYPVDTRPSTTTSAVLLHISALLQVTPSTLFPCLANSTDVMSGQSELKLFQPHLIALTKSHLLCGDFTTAFETVDKVSKSSHVMLAGALVTLFISFLISSKSPLSALLLFTSASQDQQRISPTSYTSAIQAATCCGDVDAIRHIWNQLLERYGGGQPSQNQFIQNLEVTYMSTLFEMLVKGGQEREAQDEMLQYLTKHESSKVDERLHKLIEESRFRLKKKIRRLQQLQSKLALHQPLTGIEQDQIRYQLKSVRDRLKQYELALVVQCKVEALSRTKYSRTTHYTTTPFVGVSSEEMVQVAKELGSNSQQPQHVINPIWYTWQVEKEETKKLHEGLRKRLYHIVQGLVDTASSTTKK